MPNAMRRVALPNSRCHIRNDSGGHGASAPLPTQWYAYSASSQLRVRPAEVGRRRILADLDDAAADRAGAGEMFEKRLAVAAADRAGELGQILVEGAEHLQHRVLVGRNTSRHMVGSDAAMRVKSRKPPAENFITSDCVTPASSSAVPTMV